MSRWFRFYDDAINDPKILKLSDKLHRVWIGILCIASKNDGQLPSLEDCALLLRMKPEKLNAALEQLVSAGLLDREGVILTPHNWNARQFKSDVSTERVQRHRNGKRNVSVTPPDTDTETESETEKKKETRAGALVVDDGWPSDFREQFWNRYPNKVGKPKALAKLDAARKRGVAWQAIMNGLERYIRDKPADRAWLNPETFINQERWADQPAAVSTGPPRIGGPQGFESLFQQPGFAEHGTEPRSEFDLDLTADHPD